MIQFLKRNLSNTTYYTPLEKTVFFQLRIYKYLLAYIEMLLLLCTAIVDNTTPFLEDA